VIHPWLATLQERDPSLPLALAALVRDAEPDGTLRFPVLAVSYRETFLSAYRAGAGVQGPELTSEEVHENLMRSVLPRLATDGWITGNGPGEWDVVAASGSWWADALNDRGAVRHELVEVARASFRRTESGGVGLRREPAGSVLEGTGLCKSFNVGNIFSLARERRRVVDDVSVHLRQGEIVGLLGPNGAGKTTTFYLITGLIRPDAGTVTLDGLDLTRAPMYRRARQGIGYLAQEPSVFRRMTVEENILAILETLPLSREQRRQRLDGLLDELSIKHLRKVKAFALSGGERRRLEITRALVTDPKFMLLDEPFAGVDPIAVHDIQTIVAGLRHRGIGVLITDHNVEQTLDIVDRAYIMFEGKVQVSGPVRDLVYNDRVAELYLGPTLTTRLRSRLEAVA